MNLSLGVLRATEMAAIAAARWIGKGDGKAADKAAVDEMRKRFNQINFDGLVVIGEGAKDEAPELYVGEKLGTGNGPAIDIAVDPLECTDSVANGRPNAIAVVVTAPRGQIYGAVDSYMEKIAVGPESAGQIHLDTPLDETIRCVAFGLSKHVNEITVAILDRPRHEQLIKDVRKTGARVQLFTDGDVAMAIATCLKESPIDLMLGTGGSTEAVLAAAALKYYGGEIICRWKPEPKHLPRLEAAGIKDFERIFYTDDLVGDDAIFTATGVINGPLLDDVVFKSDKITTHSMVISTEQKVVRYIRTEHSPH